MSRAPAALAFALLALQPLPGRAAEPDLLLVALDAVPYAAALDARRGRPSLPELFTAFRPPVPLISTFPSTTSVALSEILAASGLERSPGYEARFFDWRRRRRVGGGPISYARIHFDWREFFDWNRKGPLRSFIGSARPVRSSIRQIETALARFASSSAPAYLVYIAPTDIAMHLYGPQSARPVLEALDRALERARSRRSRPFDTVIFSDHGIAGGEPLVNVTRDVRRALRVAGLKTGRRLRTAGDVVMVPFGLVSSFELYTAEEDEAAALVAASQVTGVDLCARTAEGGWEVVHPEGGLEYQRVEREGELLWQVSSRGEDPLGLVLPDPSAGIVRDRAWGPFPRIPYPDPFQRIAGAFELVDNPASIVCSLDPGFMYGPRRTELLARVGKGRLRWTHGALAREATLGFVMSDAPGWDPPEALRAGEALAPFARRVRLVRRPPAAVGAGSR